MPSKALQGLGAVQIERQTPITAGQDFGETSAGAKAFCRSCTGKLFPAVIKLRRNAVGGGVMHRLILIAATVASLVLSLCNPAASAPERPIIFIPGILGSKLCQGNTTLWGTARSLSNFDKLELKPGEPTLIKSCGLVENISLLGPFWTIHQYDRILSALHDLEFVEGSNLFIFDYDWRLSNYDTAKTLQGFIEGIIKRNPQLGNKKFDLVAHSMGGIVARIYLQEYGGISKVRKVIYLGTPFLGSMNALATLSDGWGAIANHLAGGIDSIRKTILSLPAFYELFPRYASCCRLGDETQFDNIDILNFDKWQQFNWMPPQFASGANAAAARHNLERAVSLRNLLQDRTVPGVEQVIVAGDAFATRYYLYALKQNSTWQNWRFSSARGDGTVPVWSAVNSLGADALAGTAPSFSEHATIFDDQATKNMLRRELVSNLPPPVASYEALFRLTTTSGTKVARLLDVNIEPKSVAPGATTRLTIIVDFSEPVNRSEFLPSAQLIGPKGPIAIAVNETTNEQQRTAQRLSFSGDVSAPAQEGAWRVDVTFPGQGNHAAFFETWSSQ
jgi:pimeloyl-ACP methyl ester carboxylesterase